MNQELYHTMNLMVADVLLTYDFKLVTFTHITRRDGRESKEFWFEATSPKCEFKAEVVAHHLTLGAEEFAESEPEHPIVWMRAALMNRGSLVGIIKNAPRMVEIEKDGRRALISANASEETRRQVAEML